MRRGSFGDSWRCTTGIGCTSKFMRRVLVGSAAAALLIVVVAWLLGSELVEPQNHVVPLPTGFEAQNVSIAGSGHVIAGWWVDRGEQSPVVLLLHGVRSSGRASI